MKLYLSSYRIPDVKAFIKFVGKEPEKIKLALILNAKDHKSKEERKEDKKELLTYFKSFGFQEEELNLLDYSDPKKLLEKFKEFDVLWFNGGNTYCLRWAVYESGAENVLKKVLKEGVIYGGDSAGAILAGPTLECYDKADDPQLAPKAIYAGLGLTNLAILPHWGSGEYDHVLGTVEKELQAKGFKTKRLTDSECLMVENNKILKIPL